MATRRWGNCIRRKNATVIRNLSNLADDDVILGIAPIWEGLKRLGRADVDFTYAGMDIFSPGGDQQIVGAVGTRSRFIMPLILCAGDPEELENQSNDKCLQIVFTISGEMGLY